MRQRDPRRPLNWPVHLLTLAPGRIFLPPRLIATRLSFI